MVWGTVWWVCIDSLTPLGVYLKWNEEVRPWTVWCPPFPLPTPSTLLALCCLHWGAQVRQIQLHIPLQAQLQQPVWEPAHTYNKHYLIKSVLLLIEFKQFLKASQIPHEQYVRHCLGQFIVLLCVPLILFSKPAFISVYLHI